MMECSWRAEGRAICLLNPTHILLALHRVKGYSARYDFFFFFLMSRLTSFQGEPYVDDAYDVCYSPHATQHMRSS
jgi:hypothetical protein